MICLICRQAQTIDGLTSVQFERGEMRLIVNHVPAWICPSCGEAYVNQRVTTQLLHIGKEILDTGISEAEVEFTSTQYIS